MSENLYARETRLQLRFCIKEGMIPYGLLCLPVDETSFFDWSSEDDFSEIFAVVKLTSNPHPPFPIFGKTIRYDLALLGLWTRSSITSFDSEAAVIDDKGLLRKRLVGSLRGSWHVGYTL